MKGFLFLSLLMLATALPVSERKRRALVRDPTITTQGLSFANRAEFVDRHYLLRGSVTPTATDMVLLTWDYKLEQMAQDWASTCSYTLGNPIVNPVPYGSVGQNRWAGTGGYDIEGAVQAWFDQARDYDYTSNACAQGKDCSRYTQAAWATTRKLGCGIAFCPRLVGDGITMTNAYYIVCNYGPAGNNPGQKPYSTGSRYCTQCPSGFYYCDYNQCFSQTQCSGTACNANETLDLTRCLCNPNPQTTLPTISPSTPSSTTTASTTASSTTTASTTASSTTTASTTASSTTTASTTTSTPTPSTSTSTPTSTSTSTSTRGSSAEHQHDDDEDDGKSDTVPQNGDNGGFVVRECKSRSQGQSNGRGNGRENGKGRGKSDSEDDSWCNDNCNSEPPNCPKGRCLCTETPVRCKATGRYASSSAARDACSRCSNYNCPSYCQCKNF